jgi:hypothetical protein
MNNKKKCKLTANRLQDYSGERSWSPPVQSWAKLLLMETVITQTKCGNRQI